MPAPIAGLGNTLLCTFGLGPGTLVAKEATVLVGGKPAATIMDNVLTPFPMCSAPANPTVIAATSAALGVLTPAACVPTTPAPWTPGSPTVLIGNKPALPITSKLTCIYGGVISVAPGTPTVLVP